MQVVQTEPVDLSISRRPLANNLMDLHQGLDLRVGKKGQCLGSRPPPSPRRLLPCVVVVIVVIVVISHCPHRYVLLVFVFFFFFIILVEISVTFCFHPRLRAQTYQLCVPGPFVYLLREDIRLRASAHRNVK